MSNKVETSEAFISWELVESILKDLCDAWGDGRLSPLLEADIAGYLYHVLVKRFSGDARLIHLDTRLYRANQKQKYDIVLGPVVSTEDQKEAVLKNAGKHLSDDQRKIILSKRSLSGFRPSINAKLILALKLFAYGFSHEQHAEHLRQAVDDIKHLGTLSKYYPDACAAVLFDGDGYLTQSRKERLREIRDATDSSLRIYVCQKPNGEGSFLWKRL